MIPRLTIVIPTLNRAYCVGRAIESALAQNVEDIEIIVSNNGSTDNTRSVLEQYCDSRLRIINRDVTISAPAHGNFGINEAKGKFFLNLSDDDYLEPGFAHHVLCLFERHPYLSFIYTGCWIHYGEVAVPTLTGPEVECGTDFIASFLMGHREVCWCGCVTRTSDLIDIGPMPEKTIMGDMFYWTKLAFKGKVGCIPQPISHYIFMGDNLSIGIPVLGWAKETRILVDEMIASLNTQKISDNNAIRNLRRCAGSFVARSTANQFVWSAIRGQKKWGLIRNILPCLTHLSGDVSVWLRVISAIVIPRSILRKLIMKASMSRANTRSKVQCNYKWIK